MSFETVCQTVVYQILQSNSELAALVGNRIYDAVPQSVTFPYVTLGEDVITDWSTSYEDGASISFTVHVWSRHRGREETKGIQGAIYNALNRADVSALNYDIIAIDFETSQSFLDADALTRHGVSTFRMLIDKI